VDSDLTGHKFNTLDTSNIYEYGRREGAKAANELWLMHELFDMARNNEDLIMKIRRIVDNYSGWHWVNKNPVKIFDLPVIELLAGINYPVLIIIGEHDTQDFHNIGHLLNARIPDSKLRIINGAGHISNMEKPEEFNEIVEKFLSTITA
jgi:pimeloyl-ACP methyl ester carboxylesterase